MTSEQYKNRLMLKHGRKNCHVKGTEPCPRCEKGVVKFEVRDLRGVIRATFSCDACVLES
jgi:hypothetical protein